MVQPYLGLKRSYKLPALIGLMRVGNASLMGLAVLASEWVALKAPAPLLQEVAGFLVAFCITSGVMVTNDYFDRDIDKINRPERPIPSGKVRPSEALAFSTFLFSVGIAASALGPWYAYALPIALFSLFISLAYNAALKRKGLLGNAIVSFNVALPFIYGSLMVGRPTSVMNDLFFGYAFVANMAREILKGIPDVAGDRSRGVNTLAVARGSKFAALIAFVLLVADVASSPIPYFLGVAGKWYLVTLILGDGLLIHSSLAVVMSPEPRTVDRKKSEMLLGMAIIVIAFLLSPL